MKKRKIKEKICKKEKREIEPSMTIAEIASRWPATAPVLMQHGMPCVGCPIAMQETLEQGASVHNINLKELIAELEKAIKKKK
jgi:hybrid cluster-associated redox disulfide protein